MPFREDEAIVLRYYDFAEVDKIVILFTQTSGKLRGIALGAKRIKSGFLGSLDIAAHIQVKFQEKEGLDLVRIKQCTILNHFQKHPELSASVHLLYMTNLLEEFSTERNSNPDLFRLAIATFKSLAEGGQAELLARYFEYWVLRLEGVWPNPRRCASCESLLPGSSSYFSSTFGCFYCSHCSRDTLNISFKPEDQQSILKFSKFAPSELRVSDFHISSLHRIERVSYALIRRHLEREVRSYGMLKELIPSC